MLKIFVAVRYDDPEASPEEALAKTFELGYTPYERDKDGSRSFNIGGQISAEDLRGLIDALIRCRSGTS